MKLVTNCGHEILIDDEDFELVSKHTWHVRKTKHTKYARTNIRISKGKQKGLHLHRLITNCPKHLMVDHINRNGLDNRRCNLRICSRSENLMNSKKPEGRYTSKYKGVCLAKWGKVSKRNPIQKYKWRSEIRKNRKSILIGYFDTEIEAARAYNKKAQELFGEFAKFNEVIGE
jgi:hypothetical protein